MILGDKLYCIKDYISVGKIVNTKGQIYKIIYVNNSHIVVDTNYKNDSLCDKNQFILGSNTPGYDFNSYFIDLKKARKLKLEKLNESCS